VAAEAIQNIFDTTFDLDTTSSDLDTLDNLIPDLDDSILDNGMDNLLDDIDATEIESDPNNLYDLDGLDNFDYSDSTPPDSSIEANFTNITNVFTGLVNIEDWDTYYAESNIHDDSLLINLNLETDFELLESFVQEEEWTGLETIETQLEEQLLDDHFLLESVQLTTSPVLVTESTLKTASDSSTDIEASNEEEEKEEEVLVIEIEEEEKYEIIENYDEFTVINSSDDLEESNDIEDIEEIENIEDFETIDGIEDFEDLNDIQSFETYEEDEIVNIEEIEEIEDIDKDFNDDNYEIEDLNEEEIDVEVNSLAEDIEIQKYIENIEKEVEYQIEDEIEFKDKVYDETDKIEELSDRRTSNADEFNIDSLQSSFTPHENFQTWLFSELNLFNAVYQGEGYAALEWDIAEVDYLPSSPEIDVFSNPIPSPRFLSVIIDEDFLPDLSFDRLDSELLSLNDFDEFTEDFISLNEPIDIESTEEFRINPQITISSLNDVNELISQAPTIPEPPPYDFQAELEPEENLLDQIVRAQMSDPLYPYSTRKHLKRALKETKQKLAKREKEKVEIVTSPDPKSQNVFFIKPINLKKDPNTGHFKTSGDITVPSNFRKKILPQYFPNAKDGDYYQIKMSNINKKISGTDTCQLKSRGRIQFTQNLYNYFDYEYGNQIKFEFQKHFPQSQVGQYTSVKAISHFVFPKNSGNMMRVHIPLAAKKLTGLDNYKPNTQIYWKTRDYEGISRQYTKTEIGINPTILNLPLNPQSFYDQFTICNTKPNYQQIQNLNNFNQQEFVQRDLLPISEAIGIPLKGHPQVEKEKLGQYLINNLAKQGYFNDVKQFSFGFQTRHSDGGLLKPDGKAIRSGNKQLRIIELKMHSQTRAINDQKSKKQSNRYKTAGLNVDLITTINREKISKDIKSNYDRIIDSDDLSKMVDKSGDPLNRQIFDVICTPWPSDDNFEE